MLIRFLKNILSTSHLLFFYCEIYFCIDSYEFISIKYLVHLIICRSLPRGFHPPQIQGEGA